MTKAALKHNPTITGQDYRIGPPPNKS